MKTLINLILAIVITSLTFQSCKKFEAINTDPNSPAKTTATLLATNLILDLASPITGKSFVLPSVASKHNAYGELPQGEQYNNFGSGDFGSLSVLINIQKMIDVAADADKNAYTGLGLFIKAHKFYYLSLRVGDIPYSEALNAENGNVKPKYDTQKEVMIQVLNDLEASSKAFSTAKDFTGDPLFNGKVDNWRRFVNSFRLKVLISLSKKEGDADLKIKERFAQIAQNEPLLRNNNDNLQLVFSDKANQIYPFNNKINSFTMYAMVSSVVVDTLKKYNDYRLFYYASPSVYQTGTVGKLPSDWDAYQGTDPTMEFSLLTSLYTEKKYSQLNLRYTDYAPGEPLVKIGYAEQNFIIAEAIIRGWLSGTAKTYYEAGITNSMGFITSNTPDDVKYNNGRKITDTYITGTYLTNSNVAFSVNSDRQLKQIWLQKYLMYFMQYPYEAYYEYRRTGYPNLPVDPLTNRNRFDKNAIPVRYTYPDTEYSYNIDNLKVALERQYGGSDQTNGIMWILK